MVCPFCDVDQVGPDIPRNPLWYARFDRYPVTRGHLLIVPYRHFSSLWDMQWNERRELGSIIAACYRWLEETHHPDGYNIGINIGEAAGQTVMHCHIHVIPRYKGDCTNPRGGVRGVIPEKKEY